MPKLFISQSETIVSIFYCFICSAEVLDKHLSAVQRDHEQRSQIVERRIRDDAALEEAKRKEKAFHEEKLQQERAKQEAEVSLPNMNICRPALTVVAFINVFRWLSLSCSRIFEILLECLITSLLT